MRAQIRGVYPLGMNATNSGVTPEPGVTYSNVFLFYSRNQLRGPSGEILATGQQSVLMDMNNFIWVSNKKMAQMGGAVFSVSATLPIANNSLSSSVKGAINGGGGFADSYYQPFILAWRTKHADLRGVCGFVAPTGYFKVGGSNNVGSGYWTPAISSGQTFYLTGNRATAFSAFQMYEFHSTQSGNNIHPGQTLDLDYSLTQALPVRKDMRIQVGLVGYDQWQTTDKKGPNITPAQATAYYRVHALGFASNVILPTRKVTFSAKYFKEFADKSTFQGYSLQFSGAISF